MRLKAGRGERVAGPASGRTPLVVDSRLWGAGDEAALDEQLFTRRAKLLPTLWMSGMFASFCFLGGLLMLAHGEAWEGVKTLGAAVPATLVCVWTRRQRVTLLERRLKLDRWRPTA